MNITASIDAQEFLTAWKDAGPDQKFGYELNKGLMILYGVLLTLFWGYWFITVLSGGLDVALGVIGGVFVAVSAWVFWTTIYWRHFARESGVLCEDSRLLWRQGTSAWAAEWKDLNLDSLGLVDVDLAERKYEHFMRVGEQKLALYRPHVRMRDMELFMGTVLIQLKNNGGIPEGPPPKKARKKSKARKR